MEGLNHKEYQTVLFGALLHDVGKFYERGLERGRGDHQQLGDRCFEEYFAEGLSSLLSQDEIGIIRSAINNHHGYSEFITLADCLSAGMERIKLEDEEHGDPTRERLQSVFEKVSLGNNDEDEKLSTAKKRKFNTLFEEPSFWCEKEETSVRICKVCNISKVEDDKKPCKLCDLHKKIGERLPKMEYLIFASSEEKLDDNLFEIPFDKFGTVYIASKETSLKDNWFKSDKILDIQKINDLDNLKTGFRFIGNTAPVAKETFSIDDDLEDEDKGVKKDNVLSFEMIDEASTGDKRIGILKMDVDYLGLIFAIGLEGKQKSISRITSLSRSMDMFFAGYLNKICDDVFKEWYAESDWEHKDKVDQIFYIVYSGGDDLLIVGPWSEIPKFAKAICAEFKDYTCNNPDINISAGIFLCKPKYPISLAAKAGGELLEISKDKDRRRITIFGDTVEWKGNIDNGKIGFDDLLEFGEELYQYIKKERRLPQKLPRGFVHGLLRKHRQFNGGENPHFIPAIIYQLARNVKNNELRKELKTKLINDRRLFFKHIKIPASYALLKSRKEG